jgi:hypothetical protein
VTCAARSIAAATAAGEGCVLKLMPAADSLPMVVVTSNREAARVAAGCTTSTACRREDETATGRVYAGAG